MRKIAWIVCGSIMLVSVLCFMGRATFLRGQEKIADTPTTATQELIWGSPDYGIALSLQTDKTEYRVGEEVKGMVWVKNTTDTEQNVVFTDPILGYRAFALDAFGRRVPLRISENIPTGPEGSFSTLVRSLPPGKIYKDPFPLPLSEWLDLKSKGVYHIIAMRRLGFPGHWMDGYAVSNTVKITVN